MKALIQGLTIAAIPGLIVFVAMSSASFLLTGDWPPEYLLISASIGGMLSPSLWWLIARLRDGPAPPADGKTGDR